MSAESAAPITSFSF